MGKLEGKVAIVTGASRGIGKATAKLFAAEGASVICASRSINEGDSELEGSLNTTVSEITEAGGTAAVIYLDVTSEDSCKSCFESAKDAYGPVNVLVNNAVSSHFYNIVDMSVEQFEHCFKTAVEGPFMMIKKVLPDMIARRSGAIVNISSAAAIGPGRGPYEGSGMAGTVYGATKAALERITQGLAEEVYQYGISVSSVAPGVGVATPFLISTGRAKSADDPRYEPAEMMAKAILLLATEPVDKVTGRVTYSQAILKEFGWIKDGKGLGIDRPGSGFSQI
jgi:NAD(P)-dependent dehydrogenase (short-subunit alcohol dehydrogenase family)